MQLNYIMQERDGQHTIYFRFFLYVYVASGNGQFLCTIHPIHFFIDDSVDTMLSSPIQFVVCGKKFFFII